MSHRSYYCQNDACSFFKAQLKKGKMGNKARWQIIRKALIVGESFLECYCPQCKWILRVNMEKRSGNCEIDKREPPVLELLSRLTELRKNAD